MRLGREAAIAARLTLRAGTGPAAIDEQCVCLRIMPYDACQHPHRNVRDATGSQGHLCGVIVQKIAAEGGDARGGGKGGHAV